MKLYTPAIVKKEIDDSHYYWVDGKFTPGVTTILSETMPMPYALRQWIGDVGNEKAEAKLQAAGERGTLFHNTCEQLMLGVEVKLKEIFPKKADQKAMVGFVNWFNEYKPVFEPTAIEQTVASEMGFAGTLDLFCKIDGEPVIVDFKTSTSVHDSHKLQLTAYQQAVYEMLGVKAARMIVHLHSRVKSGYTVYGEDKMNINKKPLTIDDFECVMNMYKMLNGGRIPEPPEVDTYPDTIKLFEEAK